MSEHDKPMAAAFAARLKEFRTAAGLTMEALGARVEPPMVAPAIARYESGERLPTWAAVVRIAAALEKTPNDFLPDGPTKRTRGKGR